MPEAPSRCPACGSPLQVSALVCPSCRAEVSGAFSPCPVCRLDPSLRRVFDVFVECRGNVREVHRRLGVSYPTARQRVAALFRALSGEQDEALAVLGRLREGHIDVDTAVDLLRGLSQG